MVQLNYNEDKMKIRERLNDWEWTKLQEVNALLTTLSEHHHCNCDCELCSSRALTDVQSEEFRTIHYLPIVSDRN